MNVDSIGIKVLLDGLEALLNLGLTMIQKYREQAGLK